MMYATTCRSNTFCATGPKEKLDSTAVSQPAIYVASLAALEKLKQQEGEVSHALWAQLLVASIYAGRWPAGCHGC